MAVAFTQHSHDLGGFFKILGHHFRLLSGFGLAEQSNWKINQNKYNLAREKILTEAGKSHNRAIIQQKATGE
jgi:hypothetical protein